MKKNYPFSIREAWVQQNGKGITVVFVTLGECRVRGVLDELSWSILLCDKDSFGGVGCLQARRLRAKRSNGGRDIVKPTELRSLEGTGGDAVRGNCMPRGGGWGYCVRWWEMEMEMELEMQMTMERCCLVVPPKEAGRPISLSVHSKIVGLT